MTKTAFTPACLAPVAAMTVGAALALHVSLVPSIVQAEDCVVAPDTDTPDQREPDGTASQTLTETLADCEGVLTPAPVGDRQLVEPAPEAGETPVIDPGEVPLQPNDD